MSEISRDPEDLVRQAMSEHHYPDGFVLFLGTLFAPTQDRDDPGRGFTHKIGDEVRISTPSLGTLANRVTTSRDAPPPTAVSADRDRHTGHRRGRLQHGGRPDWDGPGAGRSCLLLLQRGVRRALRAYHDRLSGVLRVLQCAREPDRARRLTGPTQTCHLTAGWNLLGNPFSGSAQLPAGLTGYYWDPGSQQYLQLNTIPQGGAVYVYATVAEDVILTYQGVPATTPTGSTTTTTTTAKVVSISDTTTGPITIHVGDQIQVVFTHPNAEVVSYDSLYFNSVAGGATYPTTCYNPNFCVVSIDSTTWVGQAKTIGTTDLTFSPLCYSNSPAGCLFSPHDVKVDVIQ